MLKTCFSLPKLVYFLRTSTCFNHPALSKKYDETVRDGLFKVCNVNVIVILSTLSALPAKTGGLGLSSASILTLLTFLAPLLVQETASDFHRRFSGKHWKTFCLQNRLRIGWVGRMIKIVLSMEPRKIVHHMSTSKPPKIWYLDWMTNVRKFLTLITAISGLNGWTLFLAIT